MQHTDSGVFQLRIDNEFWKIYYPRENEKGATQFYKDVKGTLVHQFFLDLDAEDIVVFFLKKNNTEMATSLIKAYLTGYKNRGYIDAVRDARWIGDY